jgi:monofunctional glycosyltransferase
MARAKRRSRVALRALSIATVVVLVVLLTPYLVTPLYLVLRPVSTLMLWRFATGARVERIWEPIDQISPELLRAVIIGEDARFCSHFGIDLHQLREAIEEADDIADARGGSTITQQLAKNLFLWPGRSFIRKGLEFPLALWINLIIPKRRQLEIYLNIVEWGPNGIFGAEAASRRAFSISARDLDLHEASTLAAILPNPIERNPRQPSPGVGRIAGIYEVRSISYGNIDSCVQAPLPPPDEEPP